MFEWRMRSGALDRTRFKSERLLVRIVVDSAPTASPAPTFR
jgi:hypothetical protein